MEFPDYYYSGFDWTAFACTACRIRLLAMQVEIQGDFVLSLHDCHAYAAAADFSAKLFSGELAAFKIRPWQLFFRQCFSHWGYF